MTMTLYTKQHDKAPNALFEWLNYPLASSSRKSATRQFCCFGRADDFLRQVSLLSHSTWGGIQTDPETTPCQPTAFSGYFFRPFEFSPPRRTFHHNSGYPDAIRVPGEKQHNNRAPHAHGNGAVNFHGASPDAPGCSAPIACQIVRRSKFSFGALS
ncbi:hypothetical protein SAMN04488109_4625 [Chryseolinea serpens]|uniref:Uncharacterized protein n=1 Tax=Chryseolinea serpens TaxID=947013 RepID=A0A1M5UEA3_9BACT|nr:hypothetical protein SAMN04488109_4625 [Chryseolinea serpens]